MNNIIGTLKGMYALTYTLLKSLFNKNTLIYRCPTCDLVIKNTWDECPRCEEIFDWNGFVECT
jgi:rubrerythrin